MQFFIPTTIFIATVFGFLFGAIWFSPVLFMKAWMMGQGVVKGSLPKRSKVYIFQIGLYSLLAHGAMTAVLALVFDLLEVTTYKVASSLGALLTLGFIVTTQYIEMLYSPEETHWSKKNQIKFLVNAGYYICVVVVISASLIFIGIR